MNCLEIAKNKYPAARSTINSLKAQLLFKSNQLEQCVAVLQQMKTSSLNDASLMRLLKDVYLKLNDWGQLEKLLPALEKNSVINGEEAELIRVRIFMENLYRISNQRTDFSATEISSQLEKAWKKGTALYKHDEKIVKHYADLLFKLDRKEQASKAIEVALNRSWSDELIKRYGELDFGTPHRQLVVAESWIQNKPGNARLLVTLGRLAMRNELWGKAREYFDNSIEISSTAEAHGELARLLKFLGEEKLADEHQEKFLQGVGAQLPNLSKPKALDKV